MDFLNYFSLLFLRNNPLFLKNLKKNLMYILCRFGIFFLGTHRHSGRSGGRGRCLEPGTSRWKCRIIVAETPNDLMYTRHFKVCFEALLKVTSKSREHWRSNCRGHRSDVSYLTKRNVQKMLVVNVHLLQIINSFLSVKSGKRYTSVYTIFWEILLNNCDDLIYLDNFINWYIQIC